MVPRADNDSKERRFVLDNHMETTCHHICDAIFVSGCDEDDRTGLEQLVNFIDRVLLHDAVDRSGQGFFAVAGNTTVGSEAGLDTDRLLIEMLLNA